MKKKLRIKELRVLTKRDLLKHAAELEAIIEEGNRVDSKICSIIIKALRSSPKSFKIIEYIDFLKTNLVKIRNGLDYRIGEAYQTLFEEQLSLEIEGVSKFKIENPIPGEIVDTEKLIRRNNTLNESQIVGEVSEQEFKNPTARSAEYIKYAGDIYRKRKDFNNNLYYHLQIIKELKLT